MLTDVLPAPVVTKPCVGSSKQYALPLMVPVKRCSLVKLGVVHQGFSRLSYLFSLFNNELKCCSGLYAPQWFSEQPGWSTLVPDS